jgi:hypothetical protein
MKPKTIIKNKRFEMNWAFVSLLFIIITSFSLNAQYDDLYYDSSYDGYTGGNEHLVYDSDTTIDGDGDTYVTNNYYQNNNDDFYDDFYYSRRIRRFYNRYWGFGYYSNFYNWNNPYWFNTGWNNPYCFNAGWNNPYWFNAGWNNPFFTYNTFGWGYSTVTFMGPSFGWGYPGYYSYYNNAYWNGFNNGFYSNNNYWNSYNDNAYSGPNNYYYGHRTSMSSNSSVGGSRTLKSSSNGNGAIQGTSLNKVNNTSTTPLNNTLNPKNSISDFNKTDLHKENVISGGPSKTLGVDRGKSIQNNAQIINNNIEKGTLNTISQPNKQTSTGVIMKSDLQKVNVAGEGQDKSISGQRSRPVNYSSGVKSYGSTKTSNSVKTSPANNSVNYSRSKTRTNNVVKPKVINRPGTSGRSYKSSSSSSKDYNRSSKTNRSNSKPNRKSGAYRSNQGTNRSYSSSGTSGRSYSSGKSFSGSRSYSSSGRSYSSPRSIGRSGR